MKIVLRTRDKKLAKLKLSSIKSLGKKGRVTYDRTSKDYKVWTE